MGNMRRGPYVCGKHGDRSLGLWKTRVPRGKRKIGCVINTRSRFFSPAKYTFWFSVKAGKYLARGQDPEPNIFLFGPTSLSQSAFYHMIIFAPHGN